MIFMMNLSKCFNDIILFCNFIIINRVLVIKVRYLCNNNN